MAAKRTETKPAGLGKRMPKPEELYRDLIKAGIVKVVRRRGLPPLIEWL